MKIFAWTLLAVVGTVIFGATVFVLSGAYDVSATDQHLRPTYRLLKFALHRSVNQRAEDLPVPELGTPEQLERGFAIFRDHCVQCHGGPGVPPAPFARALTPLATPLQKTGREETPSFIFWVIRRGIKMTGMPAWEYHLSDEDMWATTAFIKLVLPKLTPAQYYALDAPKYVREEPAIGPPDVRRGKRALDAYGCIACHEIPDQVGPEARLGPPLHSMGARETIAGVLPNTFENMMLFLRAPQKVSPLTAMPDLGVTERDARDMAAYLGTLKR